MSLAFDAGRCDLCGSSDYSVLVHLPTGRALRSDRGLVPRSLLKMACSRCGLVRCGESLDAAALEALYQEDYRVGAQPEHTFYTPRGPVSRSAVLCDWLVTAMGPHRWEGGRRCLEVGAGSGLLLRELAARFPGASFEGVEPNRAAVELARERGLAVWQGTPEDPDVEPYDLAYCVAVVEHVPSPAAFLRSLRGRLRPGGLLFLCQPTQDVPSYDLFFLDHLHHFGTEHLRGYARRCGFRERGFVVGHPLMPNFSLHLWEAMEPEEGWTWSGPPGYTTCGACARAVSGDMERLDAALARLREEGRTVAAFGLNEVYWLARVYSALGELPLACGMDDDPGKPEYARLPFPVVRPEEAPALGVQDVLLTMNRFYYERAARRIEGLGMRAHPVLSGGEE